MKQLRRMFSMNSSAITPKLPHRRTSGRSDPVLTLISSPVDLRPVTRLRVPVLHRSFALRVTGADGNTMELYGQWRPMPLSIAAQRESH